MGGEGDGPVLRDRSFLCSTPLGDLGILVNDLNVSISQWSWMLHVHRVDDEFDLLDVRPFMDNQPFCIGQHGWFEDPSHPRHCCHT